MTLQERWRVIPPNEASSELERLLSLPKLDRKLELACIPPTVVVNDINWIFVDVINEPEGFGGRFAATLADQSEGGWLLEATKIWDKWIWEIYHKGTKLSAGGDSRDMITALEACTNMALILKGSERPNFHTINANKLVNEHRM